jgi:hypothetical protein
MSEFNEMSIINQCREFLTKSSARYSQTINRAIEDLRRYSGDFWTKEYLKKYRPGKRRFSLALNNWNTMCNAIASPFSNSPWHTELCEDNMGDLQEQIDQVESDNDTKNCENDAFRKEVLTGYGYISVTTVQDELTGEPKIALETAQNLGSVAMDPTINTPDGSDAEEGAIVNYMPVRKAKRLFGEDVVPFDYPRNDTALGINSIDQWDVPEDCVPVVSYYVKNEQGFVEFYRIVGNKVVQRETLPITIIPIVRFAGNQIYEENQLNYNGIVQQTLPLELGANIAYSTLIERCGRSTKANYLIHVDAIDGLEKSYANSDNEDSMAVLWKGEHQPVPLIEQFQTGDLQATIQTTRTLMEDVMGIPLTGIANTQQEKTATEILRQQMSKESNTANYYNNAFIACRTIARIVIQLLNGGQEVKFTLENGPSIITRQMKQRQELTALSAIMPDSMKPILAKFFADTLKNDIGEDLSRNIVANLPPELQIVSDIEDPAAIHQLNQMKNQMDLTMQELENMKTENEELRNQLTMAQMTTLQSREKNLLDWQKFQIAEKDKMMIEAAKLEQTAVKNENDNSNTQDQNLIKAADVAIKAADNEIERQQEVTDAYSQGKIEGVSQSILRGGER